MQLSTNTSLCFPSDMAYTSKEDWALGSSRSMAGRDKDWKVDSESFIEVLASFEWMAIIWGIAGFLALQMILQTIWKKGNKQEVTDLAMLKKPASLKKQPHHELNAYVLDESEENDGYKFSLGEDFDEDNEGNEGLEFKDCVDREDNEEDEEEEEDGDAGTAKIGFPIDRHLNEELRFKLAYFFRDLGILESQSAVSDRSTKYEYENSDEEFERITDEKERRKDKSGDLEGRSLKGPRL